MKIFFYGGSFDPPHIGHLSIIKACIKKSEKLIIIPANKSPLKDDSPFASVKQRKEMLTLLINNIEHNIVIDDWELNNSLKSYTYNTIKYLKEKYIDSELHLVIGADQVLKLNKWKNYKKIINLVKFVVFKRPGFSLGLFEGMENSCIYNMHSDISSTKIRNKLNQGIMPKEFLTSNIIKYIIQSKLYGYCK